MKLKLIDLFLKKKKIGGSAVDRFDLHDRKKKKFSSFQLSFHKTSWKQENNDVFCFSNQIFGEDGHFFYFCLIKKQQRQKKKQNKTIFWSLIIYLLLL